MTGYLKKQKSSDSKAYAYQCLIIRETALCRLFLTDIKIPVHSRLILKPIDHCYIVINITWNKEYTLWISVISFTQVEYSFYFTFVF